MSIMPPEPDSQPEPTLCGIASLMAQSPDPFTSEVAGIVGHIGYLHERPNACTDCRELGGSCASFDQALAIAFAWLLKVVDERG